MQEADIDAIVAAATGGDDLAFARLAQRYRPELHVHCYRMLGSLEEAEDRVQETFLRAWRKRATFEGWEPLSLLERRLPPGFERVVITVEPGESRCYDDADWLDASSSTPATWCWRGAAVSASGSESGPPFA